MVVRSNRTRPTTNIKDLPEMLSPFFCPWDTGGTIQNKTPQQNPILFDCLRLRQLRLLRPLHNKSKSHLSPNFQTNCPIGAPLSLLFVDNLLISMAFDSIAPH